MNRKPRILLFDIETSYSVVATFSLYPESISHANILKEPFIICYSYMWLGDTKVNGVAITSKDAKLGNDKKIVEKLLSVVDQADLVIGHNGDKFDIKYLKARALRHGLQPLNNIRTLDTLKIARKNFKLMSNRLDYLGHYLGVGVKDKVSNIEWLNALSGDKNSIRKLLTYNKRDVILLRDVYLKLRPWVENHPNIAIITNGNCPSCGEYEVKQHKVRVANKSVYWQMKCLKSNSYFKGKAVKDV